MLKQHGENEEGTRIGKRSKNIHNCDACQLQHILYFSRISREFSFLSPFPSSSRDDTSTNTNLTSMDVGIRLEVGSLMLILSLTDNQTLRISRVDNLLTLNRACSSLFFLIL